MIGAPGAHAGAWLPEAGHGEAIVTTLFDQSNTGFDLAGRFTDEPKYRSVQASLYLDYGLTDWLAATLKPSLQSSSLGPPANDKFTGFGDSEASIRGRVWKNDDSIMSVMVGARLPTPEGPARSSLRGAGDADFDFRALGGKNIAVGALTGFVETSLGYRLRGGKAPDEGRADLSLGLYLTPEWMLLAQNFNILSAPSRDLNFPRWGQAKAQLSLVRAFGPDWRVQIGGFATLAGMNAYRENGALIAVWRKF